MTRTALLTGALSLAGCAHAPAPPTVRVPDTTILLAHDDGGADTDVAFPDDNHEALIRFDLPAGAHGVGRIWLAAKSGGTLKITVYATSALDGPGEPITDMDCAIPPYAVSGGRDGRFLRLEFDLPDPLPATIWIGLRKIDGVPTLWSSVRDDGAYFVRKHSPAGANTGFGLMPVRKTPIVRLELVQPGR